MKKSVSLKSRMSYKTLKPKQNDGRLNLPSSLYQTFSLSLDIEYWNYSKSFDQKWNEGIVDDHSSC